MTCHLTCRPGETWFAAGLRVAKLEGLGDEFTAIYRQFIELGDDEAGAVYCALVKLNLVALANACEDEEEAA